jgi:hypothetical protein
VVILFVQYKTVYQQKQANNYTQEELQETYGFLLLETENQVRELDCIKINFEVLYKFNGSYP